MTKSAIYLFLLLGAKLAVGQIPTKDRDASTVSLAKVTLTIKPIDRSSINGGSLTVPKLPTLTKVDVNKKNGTINLPIQKGKPVVFKDIRRTEAQGKNYQLRGILDNRFYVIFAKYYEWGETILVNEITGEISKIWGEPYLSPDNMRIVTFSGSVSYDIMPNGIQMFKIDNGTLKLEWEYKISDWEPRSVVWKDSQSLYVKKYIPDYLSATKHPETKYIEIDF